MLGCSVCYVCVFRRFQITLQNDTWLWSLKGVEGGSDERRKVSGIPQELSRIPSYLGRGAVLAGHTTLLCGSEDHG